MRLQTRIFTVAFTVSSLLLVFSALVSFMAAASRESADANSSVAVLRELSETLAPRDEDSQAMTELKTGIRSALVPLRRELAVRAILAEDRTIRSVALVAAMVLTGALAAFVISTVAARGMTARWRRIHAGIDRLLAGDSGVRFSGSGGEDEFADLERALDSMLDAMEEAGRLAQEFRALRSWGEAAAFLAHQAKTPLATIALSAASIRASAEDGGAVADGTGAIVAASSRIENESARIAAFLARLGALSSLGELALAPVDPARAVLDAAALLSPRFPMIQKAAIELGVSGTGPLPQLDAGYLREVFVNLLTNTAEACAERQLAFAAAVAIRREAATCTVSYTDTITDLPADIVSKIGSRRFTTKANGSGLGIWLVGRIVVMQGGELRIEHTSSGGLGFIMKFPARGG